MHGTNMKLKMRWVVCVAHMGEKRNAYRILVRKTKKKKPLGRLDVDGRIILNWILKEQNWNVMAWMHVTQNLDKWQAVIKTVMNLHVPWNGGNFLTIWGTVSFSRSARSCGVTCYQHRSFSLVHICVRRIFIESNRRNSVGFLWYSIHCSICV